MNFINKMQYLTRRFFEVSEDEGLITAYKKSRVRVTDRIRIWLNQKNAAGIDETQYRDIYNAYISTSQTKTNTEYESLPSYDLSKENLPANLIAFYLPQYHPIPENDAWWGKGFTEWANVSKAVPDFVGHYQPRLPGELGFYDLRVPEVQERQVELAQKFGVHGFCFYYYWFNGKRLLELPLDQFVINPKIDFPFCLCWANENWTRVWDGLDNEVLIAQSHSPDSDSAFIKDITPYLINERYIRIDGRPLLGVYRPQLLPDPEMTVKKWREYCKGVGLDDLYLIAIQSGRKIDPRTLGFDAAAEFPPHGIPTLPKINTQLKFTNPNFTGMVFDYQQIAEQMCNTTPPDYRLFKTVITSWDNTARSQDAPLIFHNSSPQIYQSWLSSAIKYTVENAPAEERIVFINAWNEWAESTYLEPDRKFGYAYLNATAQALLSKNIDIVLHEPILDSPTPQNRRCNTAVIFHMYYPELWDDTLVYLDNLNHDFDFFVSIPEDVNFNQDLILNKFPNAVIYSCTNRGRDIAPFLKLFSMINPEGYKYVCKIHTKKSLHRKDGIEWRKEILEELLGSDSQVNAIKQHLDDANIGIIGPKNHIISTRYFMGGNLPIITEQANRLKLDYTGEFFNFIAGSMFWFKPSAIEPILNLDLKDTDFPEESGQKDGTLAHALERILCLLAEKNGFHVIQTGTYTSEPNDDYNFAVPFKG